MPGTGQIDAHRTIAAVRERRKELGLRLRDMADGLHMIIAAYHKIENGETALTLVRLNDIAEILFVAPFSLIRTCEGC